MENVIFNNGTNLLFDVGKIENFNINVADVEDSNYYSRISNEEILLNELIYLSLIKGGILNLNDQISYYSTYYVTGDYILTIAKKYDQYGISYVQEYHFKVYLTVLSVTFSQN